MRSEHTPAVLRALEAARRWAGRQGATTVETRHLLLGLVEEEEGRAATLLRRAGLDLATLHALSPTPLPDSEQTVDALSPASQKALDEARTFTGSKSLEGAIASDQVLLALLHGDPALRQQLETLGLSWPRLEEEALAVQGPPIRPEQSLLLDEPPELHPAAERMETSRILDAAANRAREALRVLEDYCRFVLDDAFLSGELKRLRHDLAAALLATPYDSTALLAARETLRDVGTALTTPTEHERHSLLAVVQANCKRLQEALRSLEEFGKLAGSALGRAVEKLRYRSYTLERALVLGTSSRQRLADARLYVLLTGSQCAAALDWTIGEVAAGGADVVQLREKELDDRELFARARQVRQLTRQAGVLFILNDRADIARLVEADGVHLGQEDLPVKEARRLLGPDALIGVSTHNLEQLRQAVLDGASYVGVGPTFPSGTKEFEAFPGLEFVRQALAETTLPAFAIGGIKLENIEEARAAGARRVAVGQALSQADDPRAVAAELRRLLLLNP